MLTLPGLSALISSKQLAKKSFFIMWLVFFYFAIFIFNNI